MKKLFLIFVILNLILISTKEKEIIDLTNKPFSEIVYENNSLWFVKFFAPWCPHCQKLKPIFEELAQKFENHKILFGEVNCQNNSKLCHENDIEGFPTLILYNDGASFKFSEERTIDNMKDFVKHMTQSPIQMISNLNTLQHDLSPNYSTFLLVSTPETKNKKYHKIFSKFSNQYRKKAKFIILELDDPKNSKLYQDSLLGQKIHKRIEKSESFPLLLSFIDRNTIEIFDEKFDENLDWQKISEFIDRYSLPLMPELNSRTEEIILNSGNPTALAIVDVQESSSKAYLKNLKKFSREFRENFTFCWLNGIEWEDYAEQFGIHRKDFPALIVLDPKKGAYYKPLLERENKDIQSYLNEILNGKINSQTVSFLKGMGKGRKMKLLVILLGSVIMGIGYIFSFGVCRGKKRKIDTNKKDN
ncbi:protein disulfide-isomerase tmx3 [Anaeramoeba ignava]|uniref:Protein disulfide-isomerase tmx3 n=1 Tax=Anaeramoeba ignava TaxID=1746090 RepID=A0A9Q0LIF8_ANAIG|nr:protein disulfide-isomerase tmx3 [Anaeramoeba ignava]